MRRIGFIIPGFYLFGSLYAGSRFVSCLDLSRDERAMLVIAITALALALPMARKLDRPSTFRAARIMYLVGGYYTLWVLWGGMVALAFDCFRCLAWFTGHPAGPTWAERVAFVAIITISIVIVHGTRVGLSRPRAVRIDVPIHGLPSYLDGFTIAQISDMHVGFLFGRRSILRLARDVNRLRPDLVALTGDIADGDFHAFDRAAPALGRLRAPFGVLAVNGNHDHLAGVEAVDAQLARTSIRTLRNEWTEVLPGLILAGIEDPSGMREGAPAPDVGRAIEGVPPDSTVVLLAHQPQYFDEAAEHRIDLTLSGHTHGEQIWPLGRIDRHLHRYLLGGYRIGDSHLYVSPGVGTWGAPVRVGAPPEISLVTLRRAHEVTHEPVRASTVLRSARVGRAPA